MTALITDNTTALDLVANSRVLSAESVKQVNEGIGASELTETNYKTVNAIYLSTVAKDVDDFTGQQVQDLFDVANQCPLLGGNAVFQARALYYLINPEQDFDDPTLCLQQGLITKRLRTANINRVSMVPNPASDEAILVLATSLEDGGQLMLYNSVGTSVLNMRIPADQQRTVVSTRTLAPGIYRYRLCSALDDEGEGNLIIAR